MSKCNFSKSNTLILSHMQNLCVLLQLHEEKHCHFFGMLLCIAQIRIDGSHSMILRIFHGTGILVQAFIVQIQHLKFQFLIQLHRHQLTWLYSLTYEQLMLLAHLGGQRQLHLIQLHILSNSFMESCHQDSNHYQEPTFLLDQQKWPPNGQGFELQKSRMWLPMKVRRLGVLEFFILGKYQIQFLKLSTQQLLQFQNLNQHIKSGFLEDMHLKIGIYYNTFHLKLEFNELEALSIQIWHCIHQLGNLSSMGHTQLSWIDDSKSFRLLFWLLGNWDSQLGTLIYYPMSDLMLFSFPQPGASQQLQLHFQSMKRSQTQSHLQQASNYLLIRNSHGIKYAFYW